MKVGRNDPCPCGSRRKYKVCCERKGSDGKGDWSKTGMMAVGVALLLGLAGFVVSLFNADTSTDGMVWSAEHGHYHAADGSELEATSAPRPQPPGPAPAGKVWSPEHGHWHDE